MFGSIHNAHYTPTHTPLLPDLRKLHSIIKVEDNDELSARLVFDLEHRTEVWNDLNDLNKETPVSEGSRQGIVMWVGERILRVW